MRTLESRQNLPLLSEFTAQIRDGLSSTVMKYYGIKQQSIIPAGLPGAMTENPYKLDIEKAKQLLTEAGYPDGFSKTYYATPVTPEYEVVQSLQANAAKAGVKLDLQGSDHIGKFRERAFEVFSARSGERLPDTHAVLASYATSANNADEAKLTGLLAWRSAWDVPKDIQDMVLAAAHEADKAKRAELWFCVRADGDFLQQFWQGMQDHRRSPKCNGICRRYLRDQYLWLKHTGAFEWIALRKIEPTCQTLTHHFR